MGSVALQAQQILAIIAFRRSSELASSTLPCSWCRQWSGSRLQSLTTTQMATYLGHAQSYTCKLHCTAVHWVTVWHWLSTSTVDPSLISGITRKCTFSSTYFGSHTQFQHPAHCPDRASAALPKYSSSLLLYPGLCPFGLNADAGTGAADFERISTVVSLISCAVENRCFSDIHCSSVERIGDFRTREPKRPCLLLPQHGMPCRLTEMASRPPWGPCSSKMLADLKSSCTRNLRIFKLIVYFSDGRFAFVWHVLSASSYRLTVASWC